ncbi:MAG: protein kinase, partial [Planctomycetes bacterium]|nr:protein kinase [Planctomycetota bacterium]
QRAVQQGRFDGPLAWPPFDGPDYIAHAVERLAALAEAIQFAHDRRVVHRDVKPQNAMLDERGELLLTDFGIALDERFGTITQTGPMQGTPFYMSPEQLRALTDPVDHRTDIYSLGVVLYEALSLQKPFDGRTSQEVFERISRFEPKPLAHWNPRVPRDLATIVEKAMEQQPPWRYASAGELAADLRRFLRHESIVARPPSPAERLRRWARRKRTPLLLAAAVLLALWIGWFAATKASQRERYRAAQFTLERGFTGDPRALPHTELVALRGQVEALARLRRDLPAELAATLERAERWFDEHRRTEIAELEAQRRSALGAPVPAVGPNVHREANVTDLAAFRLRAQRAADLHPFDTTLAALASEESTWPRLALRLHGRHPEIGGLERARVFLQPIDSYASAREAAIEVGAFPLRETAVRPGEYFVVVVMPGHFAELRRSLLPRLERYDFEVWLRPTSAVIDPLRMKEIPEGDVELRFPDAGHSGCFAAGTRTSVRAFHVDRAITSNGEFELYLQETGDAPPQLWIELGYRAPGQHQKAWEDLIAGYANWADLPAVGFTYPEALRYAEWRGMSLALHHEAERYLRGADGWLSPSEPPTGVPVPTTPGLVNALDPRPTPNGVERDMYALYLSNAKPVREPSYQQAPEGLFHALGNVAEYTASNVVERFGDQLYVAPHQVLILGASGWDSRMSGNPTGPISWRAHTKWGVDYAHVR